MFYIIHGTNYAGALSRFTALVRALRTKRPDALVITIDEESATADKFAELATSRGLFDDKYLVAGKRVLQNSEVADFITKNAGVLAGSDNIFVFLEEVIESDLLNAISKHAQKVEHVAGGNAERARKEAEGKARARELFALTDYLGRRDSVNLWRGYARALAKGVSAEEIFWKFVWANKSMILARYSADASEADMKPYSFDKSREFAVNYKPGELEAQSEKFMDMYEDNNRGGLSLDLALERFVLTV